MTIAAPSGYERVRDAVLTGTVAALLILVGATAMIAGFVGLALLAIFGATLRTAPVWVPLALLLLVARSLGIV